MNFFGKFKRLLGVGSWRRHIVAYALSAVAALFEMLSIAAVLPVMVILLQRDTSYALFGLHLSPRVLILLLALIYLCGLAIRAVNSFSLARVTLQEGHMLSARLFSGMLRQPLSWHSRVHSGAKRSAIFEDVTEMVTYVSLPLGRLIGQGVLLVSILLVLFILRPFITGGLLACVFIIYSAMFVAFRDRLRRNAEQQMALFTERHVVGTDALSAIRDIQLSGLGAVYDKKFTVNAQLLAESRLRNTVFAEMPKLVLEGLLFIILLTVFVGLTGAGGNGGAVALPELAVFAAAGVKLFPIVHQVFTNLTLLRAGATRVEKLSRIADSFESGLSPRPAPILCRRLEVSAVSFSYPDTKEGVFKDLNLEANIGDRLAILGPSGSGKSTLLDLLAGLAQPTQGAILVDGRPLEANQFDSWRRQFGYCPQESAVFDMAVSENVTIGQPVSQSAIDRALEIVELPEFSCDESESNGAESAGERGVLLSGGQRQRIGIARMIYKNAALYIMDEPTNNLNRALAERIMTRLFLEKENSIFIIATHENWLADMCSRVVELPGPCGHSDPGGQVVESKCGD